MLRLCNHCRLSVQFDLCSGEVGCSGYVFSMMSMLSLSRVDGCVLAMCVFCLATVAKMRGQWGQGKQCSLCKSDGFRYWF
jgi:hypothetical protein